MADQLTLRGDRHYRLFALIDSEESEAIELRYKYFPSSDDYSDLIASFDLTALMVGLYDGFQSDGTLKIEDDVVNGVALTSAEVDELCAWAKPIIIASRPLPALGPRGRLSSLTTPSFERLTAHSR